MRSRDGRGADPRLIREINRHAVFEVLRNSRSASIAELSRSTRLSVSTVKSVLTDLRSYRLIAELGEGLSAGGRKPKIYSLNLQDNYICGMEMHSHSLKVCVAKLDGSIVAGHSWALASKEPRELAEFVRDRLFLALERAGIDPQSVLGAGLCQPGIVDLDGKTIRYDVHTGWSEIPFGSMVQEHIPFPVFLIEEANARLIAEIEIGGAGAYRDFVYIMLGSADEGGISGAFVINDGPVLGHLGYAGEIGHMTLDPSGPVCFCGRRGCWEALANLDGMARRVRELCPSAPIDGFEELFRFLGEAMQKGMKECEPVVDEFIAIQAEGVTNLIHIFNPSHIVIAGTVTYMGSQFIHRLRAQVAERTMKPFLENTEIRLSAIERDSAVLGAASKVLQEALSISQKKTT